MCGVVIKPWLNLASPYIYFTLKPRILWQNCKKDSRMIARTFWENTSVNSFVFMHSLWCQHRLWVKIVGKRSETTNAIVNKYKNIEPVTLDSHFSVNNSQQNSGQNFTLNKRHHTITTARTFSFSFLIENKISSGSSALGSGMEGGQKEFFLTLTPSKWKCHLYHTEKKNKMVLLCNV